MSDAQKIESNIYFGLDGCWYWTGPLSDKGYGRVSYHGKSRLAHRISWILKNGEIQNGLFVCHRCDTPACVNPNHLFLGTQKDNMQDASIKKRFIGKIGESHPKAKLSDMAVRIIRECIINGFSVVEIGRYFGVKKFTIYRIKSGRSWKHLK